MVRALRSWLRPRTLAMAALVVLLLAGAYAIGVATAGSRELPPPAAPVVLDGPTDRPSSNAPKPKPDPPKSPEPQVRTEAPAPPVVKPTPRPVERDDDDDDDDDDSRDSDDD